MGSESIDENIRHSTQSLPKLHQKNANSNPVRDLPFHFDKPNFLPPRKPAEPIPKGPSPSINLLCHTLQKTPDHHQPISPPRSITTPTSKSPDDKNISKIPYSMKSGSVYTPHLTDAQLTNVLRIATSRSSFRNAAAEEDLTPKTPPPLEMRRPDKPPDYETALQRRELLRTDRNFAKLCSSSNRLRFDLLLEQAKKRRSSKKSVTFSDKVVLVACAGDEDNDFIPNPLLERVYKQHLMQQPDISAVKDNSCDPRSYQQLVKSDSNVKDSLNDSVTRLYKHQHSVQKPSNFDPSVSPNVSKDTSSETVSSPEIEAQQTEQTTCKSPCNLCHKKTVDSPKSYCSDCTYYMSRFQQK